MGGVELLSKMENSYCKRIEASRSAMMVGILGVPFIKKDYRMAQKLYEDVT